MACIKSAARSALVAFSPSTAAPVPYMAAGTMAGAVDMSFSSSANLEIFKLDFQSDDHDLPVVGSCPSSERFSRISWGKPAPASDEFSLGLIAGGLGDGSISVWNPLEIIGSDDPNIDVVAKLEMHTGAVRGLEFSAISPNLLASGADGGELCIWDLANPSEPNQFPPLKSVGSGAQTEVSFVSWNPKFQHILASTAYNGVTVVWDLKQQKPVTSFSDSTRRRCSVLQWNPDVSTQLIIASDDDSSPSLRVWDVRKTISPVKEFVGHTKGVIAMSWCPYDSSYLLTCAKDNRTICWDSASGEVVCELPASTNWNFDVQWYPKIPGVISASSFDMKIGIYNMEACGRLGSGERDVGSTTRLRAPKWLKRPVGASFGFGGKLVSCRLGPASGAVSSISEVYVHSLVTELNLVDRSNEFESAIKNGGKASLHALCEKKSLESLSEDDRETWGFLKVMFEEEGSARTKLLAHLGFSRPNEQIDNASGDIGMKLASVLSFDGASKETLSGVGDAFPVDNGEEFFNNLQYSEDSYPETDIPNGEQSQGEKDEHLEGSDPSVDNSIQCALVVGDYKRAVLLCVSSGRMADALVIAHVGGSSLWESTRDQYIKTSVSPYLKVVSAMVSNDLMGLVNSRPLNSWKETLALLCTFAQKEEWTDLCDALASRLMTVGDTLAATLCYICAGNIDKTVEVWSRNLKPEHDGRRNVDFLQDLMEKTIVLAVATGHKRLSPSLSKLVEIYAELLASQGLLTTAMEYLKLLGCDDSSHELSILRDRIALAAEESGAPQNLAYEVGLPQPEHEYIAEGSSVCIVNNSQPHYQDNSQPQQHSFHGNQFGEGYSQSIGAYGGYHPVQQTNPVPYHSAQPSQIFLPSQTPQVPQTNFAPSPAPTQPSVRNFAPAAPRALKNMEQYQQPSLGSQLYPGSTNYAYQPGPPPGSAPPGVNPIQAGPIAGQNFPQAVPSAVPHRGFMPATSGFVQRTGVSPVLPSSSIQPAQAQSVAVPPLQPPVQAPPTVETVDTSNVPDELKHIVMALTRLYNETKDPSKKRESEDCSRKIGSLFAKLNCGDVSPGAVSKLSQLCRALDSGDYNGAIHHQVLMTTSDWDECSSWLVVLKRMLKTRQSMRL